MNMRYLILSICDSTGELWVKIDQEYFLKRYNQNPIPLDGRDDPFVSSHVPTRKE